MNPIWFIFFIISSTKNVNFENNLSYLLLCKIYLKTNYLLKTTIIYDFSWFCELIIKSLAGLTWTHSCVFSQLVVWLELNVPKWPLSHVWDLSWDSQNGRDYPGSLSTFSFIPVLFAALGHSSKRQKATAARHLQF